MKCRFLVVALVVLGASAGTAEAAPPTLSGVGFGASDHPITGTGGLAFRCEENPDGTVTQVMDAKGTSTTGPYPGTWDEHAEWRVRWVPGTLPVDLLSFRATFHIRSAAGEVTGTKSLRAPVENFGYPNGFCDDVGRYMDGQELDYSATIINDQGVFADHGTASITTSPVDLIGSTVVSSFSERFTSELAAPQQNESALFGARRPGGSFSAMSTNTKRASPFVLWFPATVRKVYAYVDGKGATTGSQVIRAVLYRRESATGGPGAYVTRSFEFTIAAGTEAHWQPLWLAPVPRLDPGVYWVGIQSGATNGVARFAWSSKPSSRRYNVDVFADGASDPFGTGFGDDEQMSVLAVGSY